MTKDIFYFDSHINDNSLNARVYQNNDSTLLFTGFMLNETLQVQITNSWGKQDDFISKIQESGTNTANEIVNNIRSVDRITGGLASGATGTNDQLNSKYISASNFYKAFNGTDISYPGLEIMWYLITDTSRTNITSVFKNRLKLFVGKFTAESISGELTGRISAPNNFRMPSSFGTDIQGSFTIKTRNSVMRNLLCSEVFYEISPQRTQNNKPLFIIAKFKFIPGSLVTLNNLKNNHIK